MAGEKPRTEECERQFGWADAVIPASLAGLALDSSEKDAAASGVGP